MIRIETIEMPDPLATRRHALEMIGRAESIPHYPRHFIVHSEGGRTVAKLTPGDRVVFSWNPMSCVLRVGIGVCCEGFVDASAVAAACTGDYVYRVGEALTPSIEERLTLLEKQAGIK